MVRRRPFSLILVVLSFVATATAGGVAGAQDLIFADGFESGDLSAWNSPPSVPPVVSLAEASLTVGESDGTAALLVALSKTWGEEVQVDWAAEPGTAGDGTDFTAAAGTLVFAAGETSGAVEIAVLHDLLVEPGETFSVTISNPVNATLGSPSTCEVTIVDDDVLPTVRLASASVAVAEDAATIPVVVSLSAGYPADVSVDFATTGASATAGSDYQEAGGTLTIPAGETDGTVSITVVDDALDENDETLTLSLSSPQNAVLGDPASATVTITDNDPPPTVSFAAAAASVGEAAGTTDLTVQLSAATSLDVTVDVASNDGTATAGTDYQAVAAAVTIPAGETSRTVSITVVDDALDENDETLTLSLSSPQNALLGDPPSATVTIADDDLPPQIAFAETSVGVSENVGQAVLSVELSGPSSFEISVDFASGDDTAVAGSDYTAASGTLTIPPGQTAATVSVAILDDPLDENDESFSVFLSNPQAAVLGSPFTTAVTIQDDDLPPEIVFDTSTVTLGEGTGPSTLGVSLSNASAFDIAVDVGFAEGSASTGGDFEGIAGTLTIPAGETASFVSFTIVDDAIDEDDEFFSISLSSPQFAVLGTPQTATVTIQDDDPPPEIALAAATLSVLESAATASIEVTLSGPSSFDVSVDYATTDGTASAGADYQEAAGTLVIPAGETSGAVTLNLLDDPIDEADETLTLSMSNVQSGVLIGPATVAVTIEDDDPPPEVAFTSSALTVTEDADVISLAVALSAASSFDVQVDFATVAGSAAAVEDFVAAGGTLNIPSGLTEGVIQVTVVGDQVDETDETFSVELSNPQSAVLGVPASIAVTIEDDDLPPEVAVGESDLFVGEDEGVVSVTVELSSPSAVEVAVDYSTVNGSASAGEDFAYTSGTLTFLAGETSTAIEVAILDDDIDENDESFSFSLSDPQAAVLGTTSSAEIVIEDNDAPPAIAFSQSEISVEEGAGPATLTVQLTHPSALDVSVDFSTQEGTALSGSDFVATAGTLVIPAGEISETIDVQIVDDAEGEYPESFAVVLIDPINAVAGDSMNATVTIQTSDLAPVKRVVYSVGSTENTVFDPVALTISGGTGSFEWSVEPQELFEGQRVVYGDPPAIAYIVSCSDGSTCELTAPGGGPPTDATSEPVTELRHAFATIAEAVAGAGDGDHLGTFDLATARIMLDLVCHIGGAVDDSPVVIDQWTTQPETPLRIRSRETEQHGGVWGPWSYQLAVAGQPCIRSSVGNVAIEGLQIHCYDLSTVDLFGILFEGEASGQARLSDLLIRLDGAVGPGDRIGLGAQAVGALDLTIANSVVYDLGSGSPRHAGVVAEDESAAFTVANTTVVGGEHGVLQTAGTVAAVNTLVTGSTAGCFAGAFTPASRNNSSDDGSAPGADPVWITSSWLVGPLAGINTDVHLVCDPLQGATITHSAFDIGSTGDLFNDDLRIGARTPIMDQAFVQIEFEEPRKLASTWLGTGYASETLWYLAAADSVEDMDSQGESYRVLIDGRLIQGFGMPDPFFTWDVVQLAMQDSAMVYRLVVDRLGEDDHIYLGGWHLEWADSPCSAGADLSLDPGITVNGDFDGEVRVAPWDIGADEDASDVPDFVSDFIEVREVGGVAVLEVGLDRPASSPVTIAYETSDGSATSPDDYVAAFDTVTIPAGETSATISIVVNDDGIADDNELFYVYLRHPDSNVWTGSYATILVRDGPADVTVSFAQSAHELPEYQGFHLIEVDLSEPAPHEILVHWQTDDGSALMGVDYGGTQGTAVIPEGASTGEVFIQLIDDEVYRRGRSFFVNIFHVEGASLRAPSRATISILDDDGPAFVFPLPLSPADEGSGEAVIDVSLTLPVDQPASVDVVARDGSAVFGEDYASTMCTASFEAGETASSCVLALIDDPLDEDEETISLRLENPQGAEIDDPMEAWVQIMDDDPEPSISFEQAAAEFAEGAGEATVNLVLSAPSGKTISAEWTTVDGTAVAGTDFQGGLGYAEFEPGDVQATATVQLVDDTTVEPDEVFTLDLQDVVNAVPAAPESAEITIVNDDLVPEIRFASAAVTVSEGDGQVELVLELVPVWGEDVSVGVSLNDGSAVGGSDYGAGPMRVTVPAGQVTALFTVPLLNDADVEPTESFTVSLVEPDTCVVSQPGTAEAIIVDDDLVPVITLPYSGVYFSDGDVLTLDASSSIAPPDYVSWFAVLRDDGSDPMDLVHLAGGLTGSFTASGADPAYRIRLVLAAPGTMPGDALLRGAAPPCSIEDPPFTCASAELSTANAYGFYPSDFRVNHSYPEQVMLVWGGARQPYLERSSDGGFTWTNLGLTEHDNHYMDEDLVEGASYYYRIRNHVAHPWTYLDSSLPPPGGSAVVPVWAAPRVLPQLDAVTWHCPEQAARYLCDGTLHLRLQAEPGTGSLAESTVRVFLNEETFELHDGAGEEIHTEWEISGTGSLQKARGYDLPACVVRKSAPDLEIEVPTGTDEVAVDLDGVVFGANGLRFEVETPGGDSSERALIALVLRKPVQDDPVESYLHFLPVLYGDVTTDADPVIEGRGPVSRHSPDCVDHDSWYYFDHFAQGYKTALFFNEIDFGAETDRLLWTDSSGAWSAAYPGIADGVHALRMAPPGVWPDWGMVGREIDRPTGGFFTAEYATRVETNSASYSMDITVDPTIADLTPNLTHVQESILVDSASEPAPAVFRFRIADADQDFDPTSLQVFNCSLESCAPGQPGASPYPGHYSWDQYYPDEGNYGWFVVEMPLSTANGGVNELMFCGADLAGNPLGTPADPCVSGSVTRQSPLVEAVITQPAVNPVRERPGALVPLDGSDSLFPEDGVAFWTIGYKNTSFDRWRADAVMVPSSDPLDLVTRTFMYTGSRYWTKARLIVAASLEDVPGDLWPDSGALPCARSEGEGRCDSAEVTLQNTCSTYAPWVFTTIVEPDTGLRVGPDDPIALRAAVDAVDPETFAFRWVVYAADDLDRKWPVSLIGSNDAGEGFSIDNVEITTTMAAAGFDSGEWQLVAEARNPATGCVEPAWVRGRSDPITISIGNSIDGVAPGRVVEGGRFRVYSRSLAGMLAVGQTAKVIVDDDPDLYDDAVDEYTVGISEGGYFQLFADPAYMPAGPGTTYYIRLAENSSWDGLTAAVELEVEPAGSPEDPVPSQDEIHGLCLGEFQINGSECAQPILAGQTVAGTWAETLDEDFFYFFAGAGTEVRITLDVVDGDLPPDRLGQPKPELWLVRPDELTVAVATTPLSGDNPVEIERVVTIDGKQLIGVKSTGGAGDYVLTLEQLGEGGDGAPAFGYTRSTVYLSTSESPLAFFRLGVLDGFGNPFGGAPVVWEEGEDCGNGEFCATGPVDVVRTESRGDLAYIPVSDPDGVRMWRPRVDPIQGPAGDKVGAARKVAAGTAGDDPVLGRLKILGNGETGGVLPDLESALKAHERFALRRQLESLSGNTKDGPFCDDATLNCSSQGDMVFRSTRLQLGPDEQLVDLSIEILDGAQPIEELTGVEVVSSVPLDIRVLAQIRNTVTDETEEIEISDAVGISVASAFGGAVSQGTETCDRLAVFPGGFSYEVGRNADLEFTHYDENQDACCWRPIEWIDADVVAEVEVPDGSGGTARVSRRAEARVASRPVPDSPCEIRDYYEGPYPPEVPLLAGIWPGAIIGGDQFTDYRVGRVYTTDQCGNLMAQRTGETRPSVVGVSPADPQVWGQVEPSLLWWLSDVVLYSTYEVSEGYYIPDGLYTLDLEIDDPEACRVPIQTSLTVDYLRSRPTMRLVWAQGGTEPDDPASPPGFPLLHPGGEGVIAWRVRPCDSDTYKHGGAIHENVPVQIYVEHRHVQLNWDGDIIERTTKVEDVELCVGQAWVDFDYDSGELRQWATCDPIGASEIEETTVSTEPVWWEDDFYGPIGMTVGIYRAPVRSEDYFLIAEPLDPAFRRGESWRRDPSLVLPGGQSGSPRKPFRVTNREPPEDLSCQSCGDCDGGIGLRNGNARFTDSDPLPLLPPPLTVRTCDSQNEEAGVFGAGWSSIFDAAAMEVSGTSGSGEKASFIRQVYLTTEDNRVFAFDSVDGGSFRQSWPANGTPNRLIDTGTGYALYLNGDPYIRSYRDSDGKLEKLIEVVSGREHTIAYDGATGLPTEVLDSVNGSVATFLTADGRVEGITVDGETTTYEYGGDATLDTVTSASAPWRSYTYSAENRLTEAADGSGRLLKGFTYTDDGWAASSTSAGKSVSAVEWGGETGPRLPAVGERMVRSDSTEGASTFYYLREVAGRERIVEIIGECACSGNDRSYAHDAVGNVVLEQDGRGYITRRQYLGDGRVESEESGLHIAGCNPADYPEDPTACHITVDELRTLNPANLVSDGPSNARWYDYDELEWPNKATRSCRESALQLEGENDRVACSSTTYHQASGQWASMTESGWTGPTPEDAVLQTRTTTRTFYGGAFTAPAFDPGGAFDPAWLAETQPANLVRSVDGPRDDVSDVRHYVYYPEVESVPEHWRGRLAAKMDALGFITRYEDYDEWGNARRIIGPTGVTTERTFDDYGRAATSTLVAGEGCDPADDPLCLENLVTTTTYEPGGGPLASVTSPGGAVTEYGYDALGRVLTTDRGPAAGDMRERQENEYDPVTGLKVRDSRFQWQSGWVERSRTEYDHTISGELIMVERPRSASDPAPSREHYTYDVAGRMETVQDANHTAPNGQYEYDGLGRLETVWQLLDADADEWIATTYDYDANGNLTSVTDAESNTTTYVVDDFGQTVRIDSPVTGITDMVYDQAGNLVTRTDGRGVVTTSTFDANGRLTGVEYDDGGAVEAMSFGYDDAGRRTSATSPEVAQSFTHSRRGLVVTATQTMDGATHDTAYSYDLDGQLETITYPSGREVSFVTDWAGRPTSITAVPPGGGPPVTVAAGLEYLPFGPAEHLELGPVTGRVVENRGHDWHYRRTSQTAVGPGSTDILDLEYGYDGVGNLVDRMDALGDRNAGYGYDDLGRLTGAWWTDANRAFEYDAIGNIERLGVDEGSSGEGEVLFGYLGNLDGGNSPVLESTETRQGGSPVSSYSVLSDDIGNVTSDGLTAFDYDAPNHLASRTLQGVTIQNAYSADGRLARSERSDTSVVTDIVLDLGGRRLAKAENGLWRDYVYLGDQLLAYFEDGAVEPVQVLADHIGMPMMAVNGAGTVVWQALAEPYGELRGDVGLSADPGLRYPGQWQDELDLEASCVGDTCTVPGPLQDSFSLFENGYRWYKPGWGRYGQADPISTNLDHTYLYVQASPFSATDPFGLECTPWRVSPAFARDRKATKERYSQGEWMELPVIVPGWLTRLFPIPLPLKRCCKFGYTEELWGYKQLVRMCDCDDPIEPGVYGIRRYRYLKSCKCRRSELKHATGKLVKYDEVFHNWYKCRIVPMHKQCGWDWLKSDW